MSGGIQGGGTPGARPPKIGKYMIFLRKIVIFHTKYPKRFRASLRNWKKCICHFSILKLCQRCILFDKRFDYNARLDN